MSAPIYLAPARGGDDDWMEQAACRDYPTEMFFPTQGGDERPAKQVCWRCPVRQECEEYALNNGFTHGIFGGRSERERRELRKNRPRTIRCAECGKKFEKLPKQTRRTCCSQGCVDARRARRNTLATERRRTGETT